MSDSAITPAPINEKAAIRRITWRIVPIVFLAFFFAFLDRVNIGFAALKMNTEIGISAEAYGWIAGIFFVGYFLFAAPSNIILTRIGARVWLSGLTIAFGTIALGCSFAQSPAMLGVLRFFLGTAEAGVYPGIIAYLTQWFPARHRAKSLTLFIIAAPLSSAIGGPVAGLLLQLDGLFGVSGWRWLFVVEAFPTIVVGVVMAFILSSNPRDARWLSAAEQDWLIACHRKEADSKSAPQRSSIGRALANPRVVVLALAQTLEIIAFLGFTFWLPQLLARLTHSTLAVGMLSALPFVLAIPSMVLVGRSSDHTGRHYLHVGFSFAFVGIGLIAAAASGGTPWALIGLCLVAMGNFSGQPSFFALPSGFLTDAAAAAAIGLISSVSNLGGFIGPYLIGALKEATGTYTIPLVILGFVGILAVGLLTVDARWHRREQETHGIDVSPAQQADAP